MNISDDATRRRLLLLGSGLVVALALTLFARIALDIALVLIICATAFLLERTLGDWLSDVLGTRLGTLLFVATIGGFVWFLMLTGGGRSVAEQLLAAADGYGFHTVFLRDQIVPPPSTRGLPETIGTTSRAPRGVNDPSVGISTAPRGETTVSSASGAAGASAKSAGRGDADAASVQVQLSLGSEHARVGQRVTARATVRAGGVPPRGGVVVFTVNGAPVRTVDLASDGSAVAELIQQVAGRYEVRAEYRGPSQPGTFRSSSLFFVVN